MTTRLFSFIGGDTGPWRVAGMEGIVGDPLPAARRLKIASSSEMSPNPHAAWILRGMTSNERYVVPEVERNQLVARQQGLGRPEARYAALIPIRKSGAWWSLTQAQRQNVFGSNPPAARLARWGRRGWTSPTVIAAVEGHAVAGGLELALMCDLRVAARSAVFGVFCRRWGVPLIDGGTVRLPRLIGQGRALDLILTGRPVGAKEAQAIGLVNRVVPKGAARAVAEALAEEIAAFPQACLRADRRSAYEQWNHAEAEALRAEFERGRAVLESGESAAGAARFEGGAGRGGRPA